MLFETLALTAGLLASQGSDGAAAPGSLKFTALTGWDHAAPPLICALPNSFCRAAIPPPPAPSSSSTFSAEPAGASTPTSSAGSGRCSSPMGEPRATSPGATRGRSTASRSRCSMCRATYVAEMRPWAPEKHNSPGFRMRTAVIETPRGPYFLKLVGNGGDGRGRGREVSPTFPAA